MVTLGISRGFVNIGGLQAVHLFVSHVTGFSAHFGNELVVGHWLRSLYFALVPFFFLIGSIFSSVFTEIRKKKNKNPVYIQILMVLSVIYLLIGTLGLFGFFGDFGESFHNFHDFLLLALLAFACGSQNAIFTHYSNSIIRTTHLTGITTDLGIGLARYFVSQEKQEGEINRIRIDLIFSFILGSVVGALVFPQFEFSSFYIPSLLSLFVGFRLYYTRVYRMTE